jgi:hypothetical protein
MLHVCMQIAIYLSSEDYETLALNKPSDLTTPQYAAAILKNKASEIRNSEKSPTTN